MYRRGGEEVKVQVAWDTAAWLEPPRELPEFPGLRVASLTDLAAAVSAALAARTTLRDFIDVYFLLRSGWTLRGLLEAAGRKTVGFSPYALSQNLKEADPARGAE